MKALLVLALVACDNHGSTPDWSRMITQPKALPYGAAMRALPKGTIARDRIADPERRDGRAADGTLVATLPVPITRALLERGRDRFDIICAACHGLAGDGESAVAHNMERRRPPSLHEPRLVALSPGAMYRVIVDGYGLMPSYTTMLPSYSPRRSVSLRGPAEPDLAIDDRWAVVAYVRTLQLAWRSP